MRLGAMCTNTKCLSHFYWERIPEAPTPAFCRECGSPVIEFCTNCKTELPPSFPKFCEKCGQQLRFDPDPKTGRVASIEIDLDQRD